ncbi:MAG TPA: hypothetical protein VNL14_11475 [Candidatus Acidoferrales bacterium]|nr:hypothetical protein [Candidatus Acidoferrales bacterium]
MNTPAYVRKFSLALAACAFVALSAADLAAGDNGKAKGKGKIAALKENHGREAGELPFGLEQHIENKGDLPSGLQKKKDADGSLTRGLDEGGKKLKLSGHSKKGQR